jgi:hypothetical protein
MLRRTTVAAPIHLASVLRGLYGRVARRLDVDPSYVSRVARGERQSAKIEAALEREMRQVMKFQTSNGNGNGHKSRKRSANHNGTGRSR